MLPTATNATLGAGKWDSGPALVLGLSPDPWVLAVLMYNLWSFAGQSSRPNVDELTFQYFISYNFIKGWFLTSTPTATADWTATAHNVWTLPIGGGAGRTFKINNQAMTLSVQAFANVIRPQDTSSWQIKVTYTLLFPGA